MMLNLYTVIYNSCLRIKSFVAGIAHREGFPRERAIHNHGFKQVVFVHRVKYYAYTAPFYKAVYNVLAVDIIHSAAVFGNVFVYIRLNGANGNIAYGI